MDADIRPERPEDVEGIHAVTVAAFLNAPHTSHTEQFIVRDLRRARALTVSLVAAFDGRIVGHVAASPVTISDGTPDWFGLGPVSVAPERQGRGLGSRLVREALSGLGPVSVAPERQGRGLGSRLVREALSRLRLLGARGCVLVGEPAFYGRFGFRAEPQLTLQGVPPQYFQALCLAGDVPSGTVTFHPAFEARK